MNETGSSAGIGVVAFETTHYAVRESKHSEESQ